MSEFLILVEDDEAELSPQETRALVEGQAAFEKKLRAASAYLDGERLRPSAEGRRVSARDGVLRVDAGPSPTKVLSAYYAVRAESLDEAVKLTEHYPTAPDTELDVRPLLKGHLTPDKTLAPGRVFAFFVLGSAPNEQRWVDDMDRIDDETRGTFPSECFLGGARLQPPGSGRRVGRGVSRRALFDGPFLESKEVIGGVFFLRLSSVEEAVRWVAPTEFVRRGAVEIRELWRS